MAAFANWENASNVDRSLAVVGTFDLTAKVIQQSSNSAVVQFTAANDITLGSAIGPTDKIREVLNSLPRESGPFSRVTTTFNWNETITW